MQQNASAICKICKADNLTLFAHTARCQGCGVLLCYPYPPPDSTARKWTPEASKSWYAQSCVRNHTNFTNMARFALDESFRGSRLRVLDYGGGGGQFALVFKSLFPDSDVHIVDIDDDALLDEWRPFNHQIRFVDFDTDATKFDAIFMNDVFEHVSDPARVLAQLTGKLKDQRSILFIDTPKQFWLYPVTRLISRTLYTKLLRGTVDHDHQQIWSKRSFETIARDAGLKIKKYNEICEFTMDPSFYLRNMGITNRAMIAVANAFYHSAKMTARNKIVAVLQPA